MRASTERLKLGVLTAITAIACVFLFTFDPEPKKPEIKKPERTFGKDWTLAPTDELLDLMHRTDAVFSDDQDQGVSSNMEFGDGKEPKSEIPSKIWTYWDQEHLSVHVHLCIQTWRLSNPHYEITVLTPQTLPESLKAVQGYKHGGDAEKNAKFIKLAVLREHGGIWLDATTLLLESLDWVHANQKRTKAELIAYQIHMFSKESPAIESWFLAAVPHSKLLADWEKEYLRVNRFPTTKEYISDIKDETGHLDLVANGHFALQFAFFKVYPDHKSRVHTLNAEDGPYKYLVRHGWDSNKAIDALLQHKYYTPVIRLREQERRLMPVNELVDIIQDFYKVTIELVQVAA